MPEPIVSIVICSYNTREMTLECLASVAAETRVPHEVIVIDNASSDGSAEAVAAQYPGVTLMAEPTNHGFAKANNIAARHARGPYLLLLNPDTVVLEGAIDRLIGFAEANPAARIWGGRTLFGDRSLNPTNCWRQMSLWSLICMTSGLRGLFHRSEFFNPEAYPSWPRDTVREVEIVTGCFFLIRREFWDELGGFDLSFVMYGEEADLCHRAAARGARPMITPEAEIVHYVGASTTVRANKGVMICKAKVTLIQRHFARWQRPLGLVLLQGWAWTRLIAFGLAARITGRPGLRDSAAAWAEVWRRRGEWRGGYATLPHGGAQA